MDIAWFQVIVALILGASIQAAASGNVEMAEIAENLNSSTDSRNGGPTNRGRVSIREISVSPSDYEFDTVTVEGEIEDNLKPVKLTDGGYTVKLYLCEDKYGTNFGYSHSYEITGTVVNPPDNDEGYMLQCTEPPKVTGEVGPLANK